MSDSLYSLKGALLFLFFVLFGIFSVDAQKQWKPRVPGLPSEIEVTPYKTTMLADGKDQALIVIKIIDSKGDTLPQAKAIITIHISGDAHVTSIAGAGIGKIDSVYKVNITGSVPVILTAGRSISTVKFAASADSLYTGSTEIRTVHQGIPHVVTNDIYLPEKVNGKILGADISFLPELESRGMKFSVGGKTEDAVEILKDHGFNYIRLRIFNQPANPKGYSPGKAFATCRIPWQWQNGLRPPE